MKKQSKKALAVAVACSFLLGNSLVGEAAASTAANQEPAVTAPDAADQQSTVPAANTVPVPPDKVKRKHSPAAPAAPKGPMTITADELYMDDANGDVYAKGNVKMNQDSQQLMTDLLNGNTKQQELWVKGQADFVDTASAAHFDGMDTRYNYQTKEGTMEKFHGKVSTDILAGESVVMQPAEYLIHNGTITRCPAKVPDYHVSADRIEMWPNDKLIAYNAKFWIKNMVIFTLPVYQTSLKPGAEGVVAAFPKISYSSQDGLNIREKFDTPLGKDLTGHIDMDYYTRRGLKPNVGVSDNQPTYSISLIDGYYRDSNANWIKKEPELDFNLFSHKIGTTPYNYNFNAIYGQWIDASIISMHQEYNLYFSRDPIHFGPKTALNLGAGVGFIHESYDGSQIIDYKLDAVLSHTYNDRISGWLGYHGSNLQNGLFSYNKPDMSHEFDTGFRYKIDPKDSFQYSQSYDLANQRIFDQDYTWIRDLHCWTGTFTYRARRRQWQWAFSINKW
jgi:LPS-assembly protein